MNQGMDESKIVIGLSGEFDEVLIQPVIEIQLESQLELRLVLMGL